MKESAKALLSKNQNELPAARTLEVSLDRADNVIEGGAPYDVVLMFKVAQPSHWKAGAHGVFIGLRSGESLWFAGSAKLENVRRQLN